MANPTIPKARGNGYVLTYGGKKFYFAGDTEGTPEMLALKDIDVAFIPMNLPYTMTPDEAADAVKAFRPRIAIPYHYRGRIFSASPTTSKEPASRSGCSTGIPTKRPNPTRRSCRS